MMSTGYEQIYADLLPRLAECDIVAQARRLGLMPVGADSASAQFLGRTYLITPQGVDVKDGGGPAQINNRSLLIHYITSLGQVEPKSAFVPINRLSGVLDGISHDENWLFNDILIRAVGGEYPRFVAAAKELGGTYIGPSLGGECWQFAVFPKLPVRLIFFSADEEFPTELQVQFDETAPAYMDFECLAFLSGSLLHELAAIAKRQHVESSNRAYPTGQGLMVT